MQNYITELLTNRSLKFSASLKNSTGITQRAHDAKLSTLHVVIVYFQMTFFLHF
jgi:hypothetical protein